MTPLLEALTDREERVVIMSGDGMSVEQIAGVLNLTPRQVRRICANLRQRLDKPSMTAVVAQYERTRAGIA